MPTGSTKTTESDSLRIAPDGVAKRSRRVLGRYELVMPIGGGGMATVYLGRTRGPGGFQRLVAIKVCHEHLRMEKQYLKMFLDEARLAGRIHHPNVVPTLDVDDDPTPYIVMEYVEGASLAVLLRKMGKAKTVVPIDIALRIVIDVLTGLQAAHELRGDDGKLLNLVHRDVSPQNILVGTDGISRVTDFGVAKAEDRLAATLSGEVKGKFAYMAPEQLAHNTVSPQNDIFAAAVVLWETLTRRRLFKGESTNDSVSMVLSGPIVWPSQYRPKVSKELDAVIMHGLERDPERRYLTASEFAEGLTKCGEKIASWKEVGDFVHQHVDEDLEDLREALRTTPAHERDSSEDTLSDTVPLPPSASLTRPDHRYRGVVSLVMGLALLASLASLGTWLILGRIEAPALEEAETLDPTAADGAVPDPERPTSPATPADATPQPEAQREAPLEEPPEHAPSTPDASNADSPVSKRRTKATPKSRRSPRRGARDQPPTRLAPPVVP